MGERQIVLVTKYSMASSRMMRLVFSCIVVLGTALAPSSSRGRDDLQTFGKLMTAQLALSTGVGAVIPVMPLYANAIGLSNAVSGTVIAAPALALLLAARTAGGWADSSRKRSMLVGMAAIAVADLGTACSFDLMSLLVARLSLGAARAIAESGERGMLADLANAAPSLRGRALATQQAVLASGLAIGAPLGGLAVEANGPRAAFLCVTAAALVALAIYAVLPETISSEQQPPRSLLEEEEEEQEDVWVQMLRDDSGKWRRLCIAEAGARFGFAAKLSSIPLLAMRVFDSPTAAGFVLSIAAVSGLIGAPIGGAVADALGPRSAAVGFGVLAGAALITIPSGLDDHLVLAVALWSGAISAQGPAVTALAQLEARPGLESTSLALPRAAGDAAFVVAPFLLGAIADHAPPGVDCAAAGLATLLGSLALLGRRPPEQHERTPFHGRR